MKRRRLGQILRWARVGMGLAVLALFLLAFVWLGGIGTRAAQTAPTFQFAPAAMRWLTEGGWLAAAIVVGILVLTALFGRIYCAALCPLGLLCDAVVFLRKRIGFKHFSYSKTTWLWRGLFLAVAAVPLFFSSILTLSLLDPYSIFGRIASNLIKPAVIFGYNAVCRFLSQLDIHWFWPKTYPPAVLPMIWFAAAYLAVIVALAAWKGRLYCNLVCPVGALLGLFSHFSVLKVKISSERCVRCGKCARVCRAGCIEPQTFVVDNSRCVACFDCLTVCPVSATSYGAAIKQTVALPFIPSRRFAFSAAGGAAAALLAGKVFGDINRHEKPVPEIILPPGAGNFARFSAACIGCGLCVAQCPERIIRQSWTEYGWRGLMLPKLTFHRGHCAYECNRCGQVCPTGAIPSLPLNEKQTIQIGVVRLYRGRCVVHREHKDCGACIEACPTHAVYPIKRNNIHYPHTRAHLCVGCGACQAICPMTPKAIVVLPVAQQDKAQKPPVQPAEQTLPTPPALQEFPF